MEEKVSEENIAISKMIEDLRKEYPDCYCFDWSDDGQDYAAKTLITMLTDSKMFEKGRRNDDAVDLCIACEVLNLDSESIAKMICENIYFNKNYYDLFVREHIDRVLGYVDSWMHDPYCYMITYY